MQNIKEAQLDMRNTHLNGATGIVVSGLVWLVSSFVAYYYTPNQAIWSLLIGGVLISPVSTIVNKIIGVKRASGTNKELSSLAMEGTLFMILCIPLAYGLSLQHAEWFFQGMLLIIGGRYLTFNTIFGIRLFWILGASLAIAGYILFSFKAQAYTSALTGSIIEIVYGILFIILLPKRAIRSGA